MTVRGRWGWNGEGREEEQVGGNGGGGGGGKCVGRGGEEGTRAIQCLLDLSRLHLSLCATIHSEL